MADYLTCSSCKHFIKKDYKNSYCELKTEKNEIDKLKMRKGSVKACQGFYVAKKSRRVKHD